jgi:cell wall-associated NlpC family hydrolase
MRSATSVTFFLLAITFGCRPTNEKHSLPTVNTPPTKPAPADTLIYDDPSASYIYTGSVSPLDVVAFAKTLKGIPYAYACSSPESGFDCSGFINYVFDYFNITVPRSSVDFTNVGKEVPIAEGKPGDLILFTGTDKSIRQVGHIGIVIHNSTDSLAFIHSSSGSANGVTITPLNEYYKGRFVKITRIFKQNENPI